MYKILGYDARVFWHYENFPRFAKIKNMKPKYYNEINYKYSTQVIYSVDGTVTLYVHGDTVRWLYFKGREKMDKNDR